jgi:hypothetical protein
MIIIKIMAGCVIALADSCRHSLVMTEDAWHATLLTSRVVYRDCTHLPMPSLWMYANKNQILLTMI